MKMKRPGIHKQNAFSSASWGFLTYWDCGAYFSCCRYNWSDPFMKSLNYVASREEAIANSAIFNYQLEDLFVKCVYKRRTRRCSELFTVAISSGGSVTIIDTLHLWMLIPQLSVDELGLWYQNSVILHQKSSYPTPDLFDTTTSYPSPPPWGCQ